MKPFKFKKQIDLARRAGDNHPDISIAKIYLVKYNDSWFIGQFTKQWYGFNFGFPYNVMAGMQLSWLGEIWEIELIKT